MLIFHPVNWIESEFSVSFVRIKLGVIKRVFFSSFSDLSVCMESDNSRVL